MTLEEDQSSPAPAPAEWPPRSDRALWLWIAAAHALPLLAWLGQWSFWLHGIDGGPYRPTLPLAWAAAEPVLALTLVARRSAPFWVALVVQLVAGVTLIATLLQAPRGFAVVGVAGQGLEGADYLYLVVCYVLAVGSGFAFVGQMARALGLYLRTRR